MKKNVWITTIIIREELFHGRCILKVLSFMLNCEPLHASHFNRHLTGCRFKADKTIHSYMLSVLSWSCMWIFFGLKTRLYKLLIKWHSSVDYWCTDPKCSYTIGHWKRHKTVFDEHQYNRIAHTWIDHLVIQMVKTHYKRIFPSTQ